MQQCRCVSVSARGSPGSPRRRRSRWSSRTVDDLLARLRDSEPELAPALRSALPVIEGEHAERRRPLEDRQEVALLLPVSGG